MNDSEVHCLTVSPQTRRILFLDIDGVLNSEEFYRREQSVGNKIAGFDPVCVKIIKSVIEEYSLTIVISSTWRYGAVDRLLQELKRNGLFQFLHFDWYTPVIHPAHRGMEIKLWLDMHPEITEYVIIDDDENILEEQKSSFVKTSIQEGMKIHHLNRVRAIFSSEYQLVNQPS